jgi:hypothetical protein
MEIIRQFVGYCRVNSEIQSQEEVITFKRHLVCLSSTDRHAWVSDYSWSALTHLRWSNLAFRRSELWIQILSYLISNKAALAYDLVKNYTHTHTHIYIYKVTLEQDTKAQRGVEV